MFDHRVTGLVPLLLIGAHAAATPKDGDPATDATVVQHESGKYDAPVLTPNVGRTPAARLAFGAYTHVQVNVDANGMNIVDDAGNEPSLAVDPTAPNRIVAGWRQFGNIASNFRQAGYAYSRDGGRTWSAQQIIEPELFRSDPVLGVDENGRFYYQSLHVTDDNLFFCDMFISDDHGETWPIKSFAFGGDKAWFAIDETGGPGHGNIYQPWNVAGNPYFPRQFNRSVDGAASFEEPVEYAPGSSGPAIRPSFGILDVGPDGAVYVAGARNAGTNPTFWVVKSSDAQSAAVPSFEQHVQVDMGGNFVIGDGPNPQGLLGQVEIKVDSSGGPFHGNVYVMAPVRASGLDPMDIHFIRSEDGGLTWSTPKRVNDDPAFATSAWQWMAAMDVAPNGRIDAVWNDTRNTPGTENMNQLFYSFSLDGGVTWSANEAISAPWNSHLGWPSQNKIGDYYQLVSDEVGAHLIWAATFNGEQDVYYTRIGDYDCNGNGVGDTIDLQSGDAADCNANGIPDSCEIAAETESDANGNGIPDSCEILCAGDFDGNGSVDFGDLLVTLGSWGPCAAPCPPDLDASGDVGFDDVVALLAAWGACPE